MPLDVIENYQQLAVRTIKVESMNRMILHCTMGMVGEIGELMEIGGLESMKRSLELGDCMWYAANLCQLMEINFAEIVMEADARDRNQIPNPEDFMYLPADIRAVIWAAQLTDYVKKVIFYGKAVEPLEIVKPLKRYICAIVDLAFLHNLTMLSILRANIAKLETRYPNLVFDPENALNRNYEAEQLAAEEPID